MQVESEELVKWGQDGTYSVCCHWALLQGGHLPIVPAHRGHPNHHTQCVLSSFNDLSCDVAQEGEEGEGEGRGG